MQKFELVNFVKLNPLLYSTSGFDKSSVNKYRTKTEKEYVDDYIKKAGIGEDSVGIITGQRDDMCQIKWIGSDDLMHYKETDLDFLDPGKSSAVILSLDPKLVSEDTVLRLKNEEPLDLPDFSSLNFDSLPPPPPPPGSAAASSAVSDDSDWDLDGGKKAHKTRKSIKVCKSRKLYKKSCKSRKVHKKSCKSRKGHKSHRRARR
jgi:hypothetical protein